MLSFMGCFLKNPVPYTPNIVILAAHPGSHVCADQIVTRGTLIDIIYQLVSVMVLQMKLSLLTMRFI